MRSLQLKPRLMHVPAAPTRSHRSGRVIAGARWPAIVRLAVRLLCVKRMPEEVKQSHRAQKVIMLTPAYLRLALVSTLLALILSCVITIPAMVDISGHDAGKLRAAYGILLGISCGDALLLWLTWLLYLKTNQRLYVRGSSRSSFGSMRTIQLDESLAMPDSKLSRFITRYADEVNFFVACLTIGAFAIASPVRLTAMLGSNWADEAAKVPVPSSFSCNGVCTAEGPTGDPVDVHCLFRGLEFFPSIMPMLSLSAFFALHMSPPYFLLLSLFSSCWYLFARWHWGDLDSNPWQAVLDATGVFLVQFSQFVGSRGYDAQLRADVVALHEAKDRELSLCEEMNKMRALNQAYDDVARLSAFSLGSFSARNTCNNAITRSNSTRRSKRVSISLPASDASIRPSAVDTSPESEPPPVVVPAAQGVGVLIHDCATGAVRRASRSNQAAPTSPATAATAAGVVSPSGDQQPEIRADSSASVDMGAVSSESTGVRADPPAASRGRRVSFSERVSSRLSGSAASNSRLLRTFTLHQEARARLDIPRSWSDRVPSVASMSALLFPLRESKSSTDGRGARRPGDALRDLLAGVEHKPSEQQARLHLAASKLRDREYGLQAFHNDMIACFPELRLYVPPVEVTKNACGDNSSSHPALGDNSCVEEFSRASHATSSSQAGTSSGRSSTEEYQRTLGALFALYWLLRLELPETVPGSEGLDGQRGFCFGVAPDSFEPPSPDAVSRLVSLGGPETKKRGAFLQNMEWQKLHSLMVDAGLLEPAPGGGVQVSVTRCAAMLTLTAIHDIYKLTSLLPVVQPEHAPYHGHEAGALLIDHDLALGYVLEHDPSALPCFYNLPEEQRRSIRFTQAELGFNHGWLVQAEAPPGALFLRLRTAIESSGSARADIAFYFAHWFTDLAGAQPTPLRGSEKLVVMFPQSVLVRLVRSMAVVQELVHRRPTELFEEYLQSEWQGSGRSLDELPSGPAGIALMRLVVQVQDAAAVEAVVTAFIGLPVSLRDLLSRELSLTGVMNECYKRAPALGYGPAFLVYYSPAFLRHCCAHDDQEAHNALTVLAEVYRAARALWPLHSEEEWHQHEVVVHIDELKDCFLTDISDAYTRGTCWMLVRVSNHSAAVVQQSLENVLSENVRHCQQRIPPSHCEMLRLWRSAIPPRSRPRGKQLLQLLVRKHSETILAW